MWRHWILVVLLVCVPAQYFVTKLGTVRGSTYYLQQTFSSLDSALKLQDWSSWPQTLIRCARRFIFDFADEEKSEEVDENKLTEKEDPGSPTDASGKETQKVPTPPPAVKSTVKIHQKVDPSDDDPFDENVHFGGSKIPRSPRHPEVIFHVGQTVVHKKHKYRGVIIAWDARPKVPSRIAATLFRSDRPDLKEQPFYTILVDTRDRLVPQMDYAPQEMVELKPNTVIVHPVLLEYFEHSRPDPITGRYRMRPHLVKSFPED